MFRFIEEALLAEGLPHVLMSLFLISIDRDQVRDNIQRQDKVQDVLQIA
jgi:hypothetical protein